jgi:hypothetical protein
MMNRKSIYEQAVNNDDKPNVPAAIRCAAYAFIANGVMMLAYGNVLQMLNGWHDAVGLLAKGDWSS